METTQRAFENLQVSEAENIPLTQPYATVIGTVAFRFEPPSQAPVSFFVTTTHGFSPVVECRDDETERAYGMPWVRVFHAVLRELRITHLVTLGEKTHWIVSQLLEGDTLLTLDQNDRLRYRCSDCQSFQCIRTLAILGLKRSIRRFRFHTQHDRPL